MFCDPPCMLRRIFGTFREDSRIIVSADPITSISHKEYTTDVPVQKVHIASENRIALSYDGIPIQDFRESYFSGYFTFSVDVTQLTKMKLNSSLSHCSISRHLAMAKMQAMDRSNFWI